jgi:hypothetical protein
MVRTYSVIETVNVLIDIPNFLLEHFFISPVPCFHIEFLFIPATVLGYLDLELIFATRFFSAAQILSL